MEQVVGEVERESGEGGVKVSVGEGEGQWRGGDWRGR